MNIYNCPMLRPERTGFTLIELMIVVAIIGILAAIAIPKFGDLIHKSNEGASRGNLGAVRSALSIYYSDMEGQYPAQLLGLTVNGKYLKDLPSAWAPNYHQATTSQQVFSVSPVISDYGGWMYDDRRDVGTYGNVFINCIHTDTKGKAWSEY